MNGSYVYVAGINDYDIYNFVILNNFPNILAFHHWRELEVYFLVALEVLKLKTLIQAVLMFHLKPKRCRQNAASGGKLKTFNFRGSKKSDNKIFRP